MKVCIYGAGAIGGWIGVRLGKAGHSISVVARGSTLEALRADGLRLREGEALQAVSVDASNDPHTLGKHDVVVVSVKAPSMADVARQIGPLLQDDTIVLTAMNGVPWWFCDGLDSSIRGARLKSVDPDGAIARAIPADRTLGCVVHASCVIEAPGMVRHRMGNQLIIGEATGVASERARSVARLLTEAGFVANASDRIQRDVWYKLWGNMTMNPLSAITGATTDRMLADELVRQFATHVMIEAKDIGSRFGIPIDQEPNDRHDVTARLGAMKTSMLQDVEAGKAIELDALVGAVRELGALTGVATPFTDALFGLARLRARELGLYPL
jgi:2-dehydropantoate 2-reductase